MFRVIELFCVLIVVTGLHAAVNTHKLCTGRVDFAVGGLCLHAPDWGKEAHGGIAETGRTKR